MDKVSKAILFSIAGIILIFFSLFYINKRRFKNFKQGKIRDLLKLIVYTIDFSDLLFFIFFLILALLLKYYSVDIPDDSDDSVPSEE